MLFSEVLGGMGVLHLQRHPERDALLRMEGSYEVWT